MSSDRSVSTRERELAERVETLEREAAELRAQLAARSAPGSAQLSELADALPVLVSVIGADHRYRFTNKAYQAWFGGAPFAGQHVRDVVGEAAYAAIKPNLDRALAGEYVSFENELPYKGAARFVHVTYAPRRNAAGKVTSVVALVVDLSQRHVNEAALRESEARFRTITETIREVFYLVDLDTGRRLYASPAFEEIWGLPVSHLQSDEWYYGETIHPDDLERVLAAFEQQAFGNTEVEFRIIRPDGDVRWVLDRSYPIFDEQGRAYQAAGVVEDITERKLAEQRLRESEDHYRHAVELNPQVTWTSAPDGQLDHVSSRWSEWTGTSGLGETWGQAIHPDDLEPSVATWTRAFSTGEPYDIEHRVRMRDGGYRWMRSRAFPRREADGRIVKWYGTTEDIHERKLAEAALRESELKFQTIANSIDQMIWSTRPDGFHDYYNDRWYEYTGVPQGSTDGEEWNGVFHPDDQERAWEVWRHCLETGEPYHIEYRLRHRSGQYRWVIGRAQCVRDEAGRITRWYGTCTDIHDLKTAGEALRESEARFRLIADAAPVPMWVTRLDRKREFVNRAYAEFLGVSYEEALDFDWRLRIHPDDVERLTAESIAGEASLKPFTLEGRYRDAYGEWRWLRSQSQPRWGADGEHSGFIGVAYDVTVAREAEADLRRMNELLEARVVERTAELEALYTKTPTILQSQSPQGRLISVSDRWLEFMGYESRDEVLGRSIRDFITPDCVERHVNEYWPKVVAEGGYDDIEYQAVKKSGEIADVLVSSRIWRNQKGEFVRTMAAIIDITDKKRTEERLRQAQKMEAVGQLTGGIAHDFNNLLTPIMGSLDMLRRRLTDDRAQRTVDVALQATSRAATLVQRLLAFARRQDLQARAIDVADLLSGMEDLLARSLGSSIRVSIEADAGLPAAHVDPNQLELAILNLGINARDAMPGGGTLTIRASEVATGPSDRDLVPGRYVRIAVTDTGIGMDAETVRRAAEPFFSTKGVGKGTGLGLSMVHGLAAQLGGALRLSSQPGVGTTAELWLPLASGPAASNPDLRPAPVAAVSAATVLLVDDEDLVRAGAADMLADLGYQVVEAASGAEALDLLRGGAGFDLLVTDYLMPEMNGSALATEVRRLAPDLPILLITGYTNLAEGPDADLPRLTKPFRQDDLAKCVASLIKRQIAG